MRFNATTINNYMALFANKGGIRQRRALLRLMPVGQPNIHPLGQWLLSSLWPVHISMLLPVMILNGVNSSTHYQMIQKYCMRWYQNFMVESQFVSGDHILLQIRTTRLSLSAREKSGQFFSCWTGGNNSSKNAEYPLCVSSR